MDLYVGPGLRVFVVSLLEPKNADFIWWYDLTGPKARGPDFLRAPTSLYIYSTPFPPADSEE